MVTKIEWYLGPSSWTSGDLKRILFKSQFEMKAVDGWSGNVLENHDQPRALSKLVPDGYYQTPTAAKALATMYYFLPGVPFIYQGQEIGMKNFERHSIKEFNDVSSINNYKMALKKGYSKAEALKTVNAKSRDNARTPMQWDGTAYAGFSEHKPWLEMGNDREGINVVDEWADPNSVLSFYKLMSEIRSDVRYHDTLIDGELVEIHEVPTNVIAYQRQLGNQTISVFVNLGTKMENVTRPDLVNKILLDNQGGAKLSDHKLDLPPYAAVVLV